MDTPTHLSKYLFDWDVFEVIVSGKSALDADNYIQDFKDKEAVHNFLNYYGLGQKDPVLRAELFGMFQESIQFIKRYFLVEGNPEGINLEIPHSFFLISSTSELFLMASRGNSRVSEEERLWAIIFLKVMHTLVHVDKDLRHNYFPVIQQQIFDRFYKHLFRDKNDQLFLGKEEGPQIPLFDFHTKAKKTRDSIVLKLLHKVEHVAEELFDRVGVRFITHNKVDVLRVIKFLYESHIIIPHNIIPSRSYNSLFDLDDFKERYNEIFSHSDADNLKDEDVYSKLIQEIEKTRVPTRENPGKNIFSLKKYKSIQFTCRQLIRFQDPFVYEFSNIRQMAKELIEKENTSELAKKILSIDNTNMTKNIRFYYPFEVQVVDQETHLVNTEGEASHREYKNHQLKASIRRLFRSLLQLKKIHY